MVLNEDMARERGVVGEDHPITDRTVMSDMGARHKQAVVSNDGDHSAAGRPRIYCDMFADGVPASDEKPGGFAAILHVLRRVPDGGKEIDDTIGAQPGAPRNDRVRDHPDALLELHL